MKVNFEQNFVDCFGCPIMEGKDGTDTPKPIWRKLSLDLFNLGTLSGSPVPADKKYMAYSLSRRIAEHPGEVRLTTEEGSFLKDVCAELLSAGAYGQVVDIIENEKEV